MKKQTKKESVVKEEKTTIMVRDISKPLWKQTRDAAEARGMKLKYAVEEMMRNWLKERPEK